ncbi:unnamed protein product [Symbiodinium microadriaticum]|nr:unnamed protein product [Symbiodinium microadriaticum]
MLNIQFSMVELQNRCSDQGALVEENADAFQKASEELAEKEEALEQAVQRQQELRQQMSAASTALQGQVRQLSQELEHCQAAKSTAQSALSRLQDENASLAAQLLQANTEMESLRERLHEQEAAAVRRQTQLEDEIQDGWSSPAFTLDDRGRSTPEPGADHGAGAAPSFCEATPLVPSVLIAAEIDLGPASSGRATLTVSPWQTSSDYNSVVKEFLAHHRVKPIFEKAAPGQQTGEGESVGFKYTHGGMHGFSHGDAWRSCFTWRPVAVRSWPQAFLMEFPAYFVLSAKLTMNFGASLQDLERSATTFPLLVKAALPRFQVRSSPVMPSGMPWHRPP